MDDDVERDLTERASRINDSEALRAWEQLCDRHMESLRARCRDDASGQYHGFALVGTTKSVIARLIRLKELKDSVRLRVVKGGEGSGSSAELSWFEIETAFKNRVLTGVVVNKQYRDVQRFLTAARNLVLDRVRENLNLHNCLKVNTIFDGEFTNHDTKIEIKSISSKNSQILPTSDLREWYDSKVIDYTLAQIDEFEGSESGWVLSRIVNLTLSINKCNPMRAGCWINLPSFIKHKRAIVNVRSMDDACFAWSVVAALYPVDNHTDRMSKYPPFNEVLRLEGIDFPMTLKQIKRFERLNDISINVFTGEARTDGTIAFLPLRLSEDKKERHVNLLYLTRIRGAVVTGHFVLIKDLSRLVGSQLSRCRRKKYICDRYVLIIYNL